MPQSRREHPFMEHFHYSKINIPISEYLFDMPFIIYYNWNAIRRCAYGASQGILKSADFVER